MKKAQSLKRVKYLRQDTKQILERANNLIEETILMISVNFSWTIEFENH